MHPFVDQLDGLQSFNRGPQVGDRLLALLRRQLEVEQATNRSLFDQDRVGKARDRQRACTPEQALAHHHGAVEGVELFGA